MRATTFIAVLATGCAYGGPVDVATTSEAPTFEDFRDSLPREPGADGVWIVDGDLPIASEKRLRDAFERMPREDGLAIAVLSGRDAVWGSAQKHGLTYCVSDAFGARHGEVVAAMEDAASAWMAVADVTFAHLPEADATCDGTDARVLFDVRPTTGNRYLARAFLPYSARPYRFVMVDDSSFAVRAPLTLTGVLRHELGHVLGFGHEHARPEAEACLEARDLNGVTDYDPGSVMHYPHCGGDNFALELSEIDARGAARVYGAPGAEDAPDTAAIGTPTTGSARGTVPGGVAVRLAPIAVEPGSDFSATLIGDGGDADLYLRWGAAPTEREYDCRPFADAGDEACEQRVPDDVTEVHLMVRGRDTTTFRLDMSWMGPL